MSKIGQKDHMFVMACKKTRWYGPRIAISGDWR